MRQWPLPSGGAPPATSPSPPGTRCARSKVRAAARSPARAGRTRCKRSAASASAGACRQKRPSAVARLLRGHRPRGWKYFRPTAEPPRAPCRRRQSRAPGRRALTLSRFRRARSACPPIGSLGADLQLEAPSARTQRTWRGRPGSRRARRSLQPSSLRLQRERRLLARRSASVVTSARLRPASTRLAERSRVLRPARGVLAAGRSSAAPPSTASSTHQDRRDARAQAALASSEQEQQQPGERHAAAA